MLHDLSCIVEEVGKSLLKWRDLQIFEGKWEGTQFKAKVDLMAHQELENHLIELAPDIPIISEEDANSLVKDRPTLYWIIDPIDGTASFIKGFSGFVTQIALIEENKPKLAAVYAPVLNELYTAKIGKGAYLNNRKLFVLNNDVSKTLIDNYPEPRGIAKKAYCEFKFKNYIECGSIALKICKVADGTADLFLKDVIIRDWDLAAPHLILNEAGGFLTDIYGKKFEYYGDYEHKGLIATVSEKECMKFVLWYKHGVENENLNNSSSSR